MPHQLPGAIADVLEKAFQWYEEDHTPKTGAALVLSASIARLRVICRKVEEPSAFAEEPDTLPGKTE